MNLMETLANKKKPLAAPSETSIPLPVLHKEHEGSCGPACDCGESSEGGCCGG